MKRVPPIFGPALLEQEDIDQLPVRAQLQLVFTYGFVLGAVVGIFVGALF